MAEVHQLIIKEGIEEARRQAVTKHERMVVEAAYQVLSDDAEKMGFTYSGFALTSLPHKPQEASTWRRDGHNLTLVMQAGVDRIGARIDHRLCHCCRGLWPAKVARSTPRRYRLCASAAGEIHAVQVQRKPP